MKQFLKNCDQRLFSGTLSECYRRSQNKRYLTQAQKSADQFHHYFYKLHAYEDTFMGVRCVQNPLDMWVKHQVIWETKPDILIETGTYHGGTALFYATLFETLGHGEVITIDVDPQLESASKHKAFKKRVTSLKGFSTDSDIVEAVKKKTAGKKTMLILDSDHSAKNVSQELELYAPLVTKDCYIIVDDTQLNGHPVKNDFGPGPFEAVGDFLKKNKEFEIDSSRDKFFFTFTPKGYLKRIS